MNDQNSRADLQLLNPQALYDPSANAYSQIAVTGGTRLAFISGQGGDNSDGSFSPDFAVQAERAFRNLGLALEALGAQTHDVVKITVMIVQHDMQKLKIMQAAQRGLLGAHHPAATLIPVPCLALPQMQIEVEAIVALTG
ncbi:MAG TPA: RidA family protein [Steroidobacteraceae bacterium]|nr:RidA family protein [Steroidobacteraceae bacterium]